LDFEALHVVVVFFSKELMLELEAYALMEKKNDETWYLFFIYVFNFFFEFCF